ncbi:MAG: MraY family glycosyltransferase [Bacteroidales bacterium]|nr:MraY family glycosyltransferase [Bacteroidales bacterium]
MYSLIILTIVFILTLCLGLYFTPYIASLSRELHLYDLPDSRKVHQLPIPRLGGAAFIPVVLFVILTLNVTMARFGIEIETLWKPSTVQHFLAYLAGSILLYIVGLYDDIHGVSYRIKFLVQIVAAFLLCVSGLWIADFSHIFLIDRVPFWVGMPITIFFVVYLTNAMNLIDGIDGLASGLSSISLFVIAILCLINDEMVWSMISVAFLGSCMAFFYYNVFNKRHKIFMGDSGSLTLGYTLSFLILHFWQAGPVWNSHLHNIGIVALSTLVIPMFDVVRVFASRIRDGRNPFLPDKNHIHHKFLRAGVSPHMTMVLILFISLGIIISNYLIAAYIDPTLIIVADIVFYVLLHVCINIFIARREKKTGIRWDRQI